MARTRKDLVAWFVFVLFMLGMTAAFAEDAVRTATVAHLYDLDSANLIYCKAEGQDNDPFAPPVVGGGLVFNYGPGASTQVVSTTSAFLPVAVGDTLYITVGTTTTAYAVTAISAPFYDQVSVTPALDISGNGSGGTTGYRWSYRKHVCGTAVTDGWVNVSGASAVGLTTQFEQGDIPGLRVQFECKVDAPGAAPVLVYPGETSECGGGVLGSHGGLFPVCEFATVDKGTSNARFTVMISPNPFSQCRIGMTRDTDVSDAAANLEIINAYVTTSKVTP